MGDKNLIVTTILSSLYLCCQLDLPALLHEITTLEWFFVDPLFCLLLQVLPFFSLLGVVCLVGQAVLESWCVCVPFPFFGLAFVQAFAFTCSCCWLSVMQTIRTVFKLSGQFSNRPGSLKTIRTVLR